MLWYVLRVRSHKIDSTHRPLTRIASVFAITDTNTFLGKNITHQHYPTEHKILFKHERVKNASYLTTISSGRLTCVPDVPGLNLSQDTDCPYWGLSRFPLVSQGKYRDRILSLAMIASFRIPFNILFSSIQSFDAYSSKVTDSVLK
jgi:hypothetical protein